MSQLNLTPDPVLLGSQAVIFLANMFIVKKLLLEPYLSVRSRREAQTGGSQDAAHKLSEEAKALDAKITERMRAAHKDAAQVRESIKNEANKKRADLLARAESEAKSEQEKIQSAITLNLKEERSRKEETIKSVANEFFAQVIQ